jgi:hypothetical protein
VKCSGELTRGYLVALVFNVTEDPYPIDLKAMAVKEKQSLGQGLSGAVVWEGANGLEADCGDV